MKAAQDLANKVKGLHSVQEIVLCGSMAAGDLYPSDLDMAVVLSAEDELPHLAKYCRQVSSTTHAWEVFVFNTERKYLGRICHKRECPARYPCDAKDCGKKQHLRNIWGFHFDPLLFLAPDLKVLWSRNEDSVLLNWGKELNVKSFEVQTYEPKRLKCWECGARFLFDAQDQKYYAKRGWDDPKRCPNCQKKKWFRIEEDDEWE
ncbi:zinc-ribbon domain containing protein [Paenibacillus periandrae]|uniref:zinc-ribbon domain containing protein n=1 Tax=Paenibacillus periandrae TaxID=1761741 RepID=UPI001F090BB8|nr:zinc-ribbon domain containing protein [Paenibacillus periandrae]